MKASRILLILLILILAIIFIAIGVIHFLKGSAPTTTPPPVSFPAASSSVTTSSGINSASQILLTDKNGSAVSVHNVIQNPATVPEPYTKGEYILADDCANSDSCTSNAATKGFRIVYDSRNSSINVLLLAEPIRDARNNAKMFLAQELGVSSSQLCTLPISVGTILSVNSTFAGEELGLSGCPDSVQLP